MQPVKALIIIFTLLLATLPVVQLKAQSPRYFIGNQPKFLKTVTDTLPYSFTGGFVAPQFNTMDMDGDGVKDLIVFDRASNKYAVYLKRLTGTFRYEHAPEFSAMLPQSFHWVVMADYNCDGKEDIFTNGSQIGNLRVYQNTSAAGVVSFEMITDMLLDTFGINISPMAIDYPAVTDIDGDGDLDILYLQDIWGTIGWYRNFRVERNLHCDSLRFNMEDFCWGSFAESGITRDLILGAKCPFRKKSQLAAHAGSTTLFFDMDEDGDMDLLLADVGYYDFYLVKNGQKDFNWIRDTMIAYDSIYPPSKPVNLRSFPAAFYLDLDDDGIKDLVVAPNDPRDGRKLRQIWLYKNHGKNNKPDFRFVQDDLLQEKTIDLGANTSPLLHDWNGDGLLDLIVAYKEPGFTDTRLADRAALYLNQGTKEKAVYKLVNMDWLNLSKDSLYGMKPAFGDLNGDGKPDLLIGSFRGSLLYYQNTGAPGDTAFTLIENEFQNIWPCNASAPQIIDIDRDGLNDLLIGCAEGVLKFYRNKGTKTNPVFSETPDIDTFGRVNVSDFYYIYTAFGPNGNPTDSVKQFFPEGFATPHVADLNRDGKQDMVVGSQIGKIFVFMNIEGSYPNDSFPEELRYHRNERLKADTIYSPGGLSVPYTAHFDGDTLPDILFGNTGGGLFLLTSEKDTVKGPINSLEKFVQNMPLRVYPNPAQNQVSIERGLNVPEGDAKIELYDLTGMLLMRADFHAHQSSLNLDIGRLAAGLYIVQYHSHTYRGNSKLIVKK